MKEPGKVSQLAVFVRVRHNAWPLVAILLAVTVASLSVPPCAASDVGGGGNAVQFLRDGIGAAGRAMGGAWTALASG
jgi:hypothetical protein